MLRNSASILPGAAANEAEIVALCRERLGPV